MPYLIRPQRLEAGRGYIECEPHQATRVVIVEQTHHRAKAGRKAYTTGKVITTFHGSGAMREARTYVDRLAGKPTSAPRPTLFRSLTRAEYNSTVGK